MSIANAAYPAAIIKVGKKIGRCSNPAATTHTLTTQTVCIVWHWISLKNPTMTKSSTKSWTKSWTISSTMNSSKVVSVPLAQEDSAQAASAQVLVQPLQTHPPVI